MKVTIQLSGGGLAEMLTLAEWLWRNLRLWGLPATFDPHGYKVEGRIDERMINLSERHIAVDIIVHQGKGT